MQKTKFYQDLIEFIKGGTCSFTTILFLKNNLKNNNFTELFEENIWHLKKGNYFVIRNDASIIAFEINEFTKFNIVTTHADTPSFLIKPHNENFKNGYLKIKVAPYGGLLNYGWLDRPLSIAGRIILKNKNTFTNEIIDMKKPLLTIPSLAIHLNDTANSKLDLNTEIDLIPIIGLKKKKDIIKSIITKKYHYKNQEIIDGDLYLYNTEEPCWIGYDEDILLSPRIDNLTCTFSAFNAFIENKKEKNINVFCAFNSEEVGSLTKEGADSNFLIQTLNKITHSLEIDETTSLAQSVIINADNTHAIHPNHPESTEETNQVYLNQGIIISKEIVSTTDSLSSSLFKSICEKCSVPYQEYTSRNDLSSGSTLASMTIRTVSISSIDIGLAQLAMHSSMECVGKQDVYDLYIVLKQFYETSFIKNKKSTKIIF